MNRGGHNTRHHGAVGALYLDVVDTVFHVAMPLTLACDGTLFAPRFIRGRYAEFRTTTMTPTSWA